MKTLRLIPGYGANHMLEIRHARARGLHTPIPPRVENGPPRADLRADLDREDETDMDQAALPQWESEMIEEAILDAETRRASEKERARNRAVQLAREQAYHRLALEIDRPKQEKVTPGQLSFFPTPTLFDQDGE